MPSIFALRVLFLAKGRFYREISLFSIQFQLKVTIPIISPTVYQVENTENSSTVWVAEENVPKQGPSEIDTVTDVFLTGRQKCIPKQLLEYNYAVPEGSWFLWWRLPLKCGIQVERR